MTERWRNSGQWSEARFVAFVKSALRGASQRWGPKNQLLKESRVERGKYKCVCGIIHPVSIEIEGRRTRNIFVDHIKPVVGPEGFTTWDDFINNLFCEQDNLQILCKECHDRKSLEERQELKRRKDIG